MRFFSPLLLAAALIPHVCAWGSVGHEVVATIAQMHLHPSVMPILCDILDVPLERCHLAPVASWADSARRQAKYRWTAPLHYINAIDDYPSAVCAFPGSRGWAGRTHINVLSAIRNTTTVLHEYETSRRAGVRSRYATDEDDETAAPLYVKDALKFLIHFIGDMHQPLHLTGRNRGGNGDKVSFDGRTTNLHSVWDSLLISERLRTLPWNYTQPLPLPDVELFLRDTIYDPYIRRVVWEGILDSWQDEIDDWLACPSPSSSSTSESTSVRQPSSTWQTVLAFFSSSGSTDNENGGGLGVDDDTLCPYAWAKPIQQLNCDIVFPKELDEQQRKLGPLSRLFDGHLFEEAGEEGEGEEGCGCLLEESEEASTATLIRKKKSQYLELYTAEYAGVIKKEWIVEKLLTQAGVRLAAVLNWIFVEQQDRDEAGAGLRHQSL